MSPEQSIANLEYEFLEALDRDDADAVGALFAHGTLEIGIPGRAETLAHTGTAGASEVIRGISRPRPDGSFGRHQATNLVIEIDEDGITARARMNTVLHYVAPGRPLHTVGLGRHEDELRVVDGRWCFTRKRIMGDVRYPPPDDLRGNA